MMHDQAMTSTKPYLIRAIHEWCSDNGLTPYLAVSVDGTVHVPMEYVNDGEIVLNVSYDATSALQIGNDYVQFKARFGGKPREISVPVERVLAIYARENGQGMAFPPPEDTQVPEGEAISSGVESHGVMGGASEETSLPSDKRVMQLVRSSEAREEEDVPPPQPPSPLGGGRPALKRIK